MLAAFARRVRSGSAGGARLIMACLVDEEHTFLGVQHFVANKVHQSLGGPVDAVVAEPTQMRIVKAHKGVARWGVTTLGRACHSSRPEMGVNAIYHMAKVLPVIEAYAEELRRSKIDPDLGPATLSVGRVEGGASVNTVPDFCRLDIDRRLIPGEEGEKSRLEFINYLRQRVEGVDLECSELFLNCPALGEIEGTAGLIHRLGDAIVSVQGNYEVEVVPYGTDASSLSLAGVPSVVFGPGNIASAHTKDESISLDEVEQASEILYRLACMG